MKLHRLLYRAARVTNDVDAVTHPKRLERRATNKVKGRLLRHAGVWRWLWR